MIRTISSARSCRVGDAVRFTLCDTLAVHDLIRVQSTNVVTWQPKIILEVASCEQISVRLWELRSTGGSGGSRTSHRPKSHQAVTSSRVLAARETRAHPQVALQASLRVQVLEASAQLTTRGTLTSFGSAGAPLS